MHLCVSHISVVFFVLQYRMTPLMCAACEGHTDLVKMLYEDGAVISYEDKVSQRQKFSLSVEF